MEKWEMWIILVAIVLAIFSFFAIDVCICGKRKRERMRTSLAKPRFSTLSGRFSTTSILPMNWRRSTGGNSSRASSRPMVKDAVQVEVAKVQGNFDIETHSYNNCGGASGKNGLVNGKGQVMRGVRQSCTHSMTLEMIKEYEEKEQEMGLGVICENQES